MIVRQLLAGEPTVEDIDAFAPAGSGRGEPADARVADYRTAEVSRAVERTCTLCRPIAGDVSFASGALQARCHPLPFRQPLCFHPLAGSTPDRSRMPDTPHGRGSGVQ